MFFIIEKKEETTFDFSKKFCSCCLICIKMETRKIANLLNDPDNKHSKFSTRKWYIINDQNNGKYGIGMKMIQPLNLKQKLLNQIFVITQMHIFL